MIGQHSKETSSKQGCNPTLVKWLLYRSDMSIQYPTEIASLSCTLPYLPSAYWVLNTHSRKMHTEVREQGTDQTSLCYISTTNNWPFQPIFPNLRVSVCVFVGDRRRLIVIDGLDEYIHKWPVGWLKIIPPPPQWQCFAPFSCWNSVNKCLAMCL